MSGLSAKEKRHRIIRGFDDQPELAATADAGLETGLSRSTDRFARSAPHLFRDVQHLLPVRKCAVNGPLDDSALDGSPSMPHWIHLERSLNDNFDSADVVRFVGYKSISFSEWPLALR